MKATGDYPAAMSHYHRALALHEELGNRNDVATVTGNIGNVYSSIGDYPTALEHYHRAWHSLKSSVNAATWHSLLAMSASCTLALVTSPQR